MDLKITLADAWPTYSPSVFLAIAAIIGFIWLIIRVVKNMGKGQDE